MHNYSAFAEIYTEKEDILSYISREGTKYGIYFILTTTGVNSVRFKLQQNFNQLLTMQLTVDSDYMTIIGKTGGLLPSKVKGRGLIKTDAVYEFQTAHVVDDAVQFGRIREICEESRGAWSGKPAPKIPMLPDYVNVEYATTYISDKNSLSVPIGVEKNSLAVSYYDFGKTFVNLILSNNDECFSFAGALSELMIDQYDSDIIVFDTPRAFSDQLGGKKGYYGRTSEIEEAVDKLFDVVTVRDNAHKQAVSKGENTESFKQITLIINSFSNLKGIVSSKCNERLTSILDVGETYHNINIIIAEAAKNLSNYSYDKWYKKNVSQSDGIWVGEGFSAQYHIKPGVITSEMREESGDNFGFSVIKGRAVKIKILSDS